MAGLQRLGGPFGIQPGLEPPPAPAEDCGDALASRVSLTKTLGKGVRLAVAKYTYRQNPEYLESIKESGLDDNFICHFDARIVDFEDAVLRVLPCIVDAFQAYRGDIHSEEFFMRGSDQWLCENERQGVGGVNIDGRDSVMYLHAVNYWDAELCKRAFDLTPHEVVDRLEGKVSRVKVFRDGALVVLSETPLGAEEFLELNRKLRPLLPEKYGVELELLRTGT